MKHKQSFLCWHSQTKPICDRVQSLPHCISKQYSEERVQIISTVLISEKNMLMFISRGPRYKGLDATFCALQMYQEYSYEADSCWVWADSPKCPVVIICNAFHEVKLWPWDTANWTIPVIPYSHIEVSGVKVLKILIKWHKILVWKHAQGYVARKMSASVPKSFPLKRKNWFISKQRAVTATCSYVTNNSNQHISYFNSLEIQCWLF